MRVTVLAGGVGSARFCAGLVRVVPPDDLTIVVNTGDDERIRGLLVCPDVDTVLYHLAGLADWNRGWGIADERTVANDRYRDLVSHLDLDVDLQDWFLLGDKDLATHMLRARLLEAGLSLTGATDALRRALGIGCRVVPMSDAPVRTKLRIASGELLDFQEYFVRRGQAEEVAAVEIDGADGAPAALGVPDAIASADVVIVPPSNPLISVEPVLATGGIREALREASGRRVTVSPIVGGKALKGPADRLMRSMGHEVSPVGVARMYEGVVDVFVLDDQDARLAPEIEDLGMDPVVCDTIMRSPEDAARLAKTVLDRV